MFAVDQEKIVSSLRPGADNLLRAQFEAAGSRAPYLRWSPTLGDLHNPQIGAFARTCQALASHDGRILVSDVRLELFEPHKTWLMLLDVENGGTFRYRYYGEGIAEIRGRSMVGLTTEGFGGHITVFFNACYHAVIDHKEWLLTVHEPPRQIFARNWERLIVPLFDADGDVRQFIVMNVPDNELRAGLEIIPDPVFVLDEDQIVRYANRPARQMFDRQNYHGNDMDLFGFSGIDLVIGRSPADLVSAHAMHDKVALATRNGLLQRVLVTISGALLWGHAFYVVTLRADPD